MDENNENKILNSKLYKIQNDIIEETTVPDHVFFGLIEGIINGPLIDLPKKYAEVSLINEIIKQRQKTYLSDLDKVNKK